MKKGKNNNIKIKLVTIPVSRNVHVIGQLVRMAQAVIHVKSASNYPKFTWINNRDHPGGRSGRGYLPKLSHISLIQAQGEVIYIGYIEE